MLFLAIPGLTVSLMKWSLLDKMAAILSDDNFKCIFMTENVLLSIKISIKCVPNGGWWGWGVGGLGGGSGGFWVGVEPQYNGTSIKFQYITIQGIALENIVCAATAILAHWSAWECQQMGYGQHCTMIFRNTFCSVDLFGLLFHNSLVRGFNSHIYTCNYTKYLQLYKNEALAPKENDKPSPTALIINGA